MQSVKIIDIDFNLLGEIDNYESLQFTRRFYRPGEFELHIAVGKRYVNELQKGRIIILGNHAHKAGYITSREIKLNEDGSETVVVKGPTLGGILGRRVTVADNYDRIAGPAETVMKHYVNNHMVAGEYATGVFADRNIPVMAIAHDQGRGISTPWQTRYEYLDQVMEKIANFCDIGWHVHLDFTNKKWVFDVLTGRDLTAEQTNNPPVIFSRKFDNVMSQQYVDSEGSYRNVGYAGGPGEEDDQTVLVVGSGAGFERREVYIDASEAEDAAGILDVGEKKLSEYRQIRSFDGRVIDTGSFVYEVDWDLGDIVTLQDPTWGVQVDSRIIEVREIYEDKIDIEVQLGDEIPTITSVVKSLQAQSERASIVRPQGQPGPPGQSETYVHNQIAPAATWTIEHNLDKYPSVTVVDSAGNVMLGDVSYVDNNTVLIGFSGAFAGKAYLN